MEEARERNHKPGHPWPGDVCPARRAVGKTARTSEFHGSPSGRISRTACGRPPVVAAGGIREDTTVAGMGDRAVEMLARAADGFAVGDELRLLDARSRRPHQFQPAFGERPALRCGEFFVRHECGAAACLPLGKPDWGVSIIHC